MKYTVELSDSEGTVCKVKLSLPINKVDTNKTNSTWKALDAGALKFHSGGCAVAGAGWASPLTLRLMRGDEYGVVLTEFTDSLRMVNDSGSGTIYQGWCLSFKPGAITWALID